MLFVIGPVTASVTKTECAVTTQVRPLGLAHFSPTLVYITAARTCVVPRTHNFGEQSFNAAGPRVWNSLPPHLRPDMNFARFKRHLKTFLFRELVNHDAL